MTTGPICERCWTEIPPDGTKVTRIPIITRTEGVKVWEEPNPNASQHFHPACFRELLAAQEARRDQT